MTGERTVVVLPGRTFGPYVPQLFFAMFAAIRRGSRIVAVEWDGTPPTEPADVVPWVGQQVEPVLNELDPASTLVIAKSLGTFASATPSTRAFPAVWVTPVLAPTPIVSAALAEPRAPFLLAGGTADRLWDPLAARRLTEHVVEFAGADHGLFVPGPMGRSARNIAGLADAVEAFIDEQVWPPPG